MADRDFPGLARIGAYWAKTGTSGSLGSDGDHSTTPKYGLGLQWNFNKQVGAGLEYERCGADVFNQDVGFDMYSLGVDCRF